MAVGPPLLDYEVREKKVGNFVRTTLAAYASVK